MDKAQAIFSIIISLVGYYLGTRYGMAQAVIKNLQNEIDPGSMNTESITKVIEKMDVVRITIEYTTLDGELLQRGNTYFFYKSVDHYDINIENFYSLKKDIETATI